MTTTTTMTRMTLAWCLAALLGSGCGVYGLQTNATDEPAAQPGARELAPEFALPDTDGSTVSPDDLLASGKPAVLVFYRGHW
jgi:cytochrome oxidase Cu insertion factor (SCO1/SenC/PrrC family)